MISKRNWGTMPTDRRTVLRRAGVQICIRDNRHNYQRQRDVVGYDARVDDKHNPWITKAREAMKRHRDLKWLSYHTQALGINCRCVVIDFNRKPMKWGETRSIQCDNERW